MNALGDATPAGAAQATPHEPVVTPTGDAPGTPGAPPAKSPESKVTQELAEASAQVLKLHEEKRAARGDAQGTRGTPTPRANAPRAAQETPRDAQEEARAAQETPRDAQEEARDAQKKPARRASRSGRHLSKADVERMVQERLGQAPGAAAPAAPEKKPFKPLPVEMHVVLLGASNAALWRASDGTLLPERVRPWCLEPDEVPEFAEAIKIVCDFYEVNPLAFLGPWAQLGVCFMKYGKRRMEANKGEQGKAEAGRIAPVPGPAPERQEPPAQAAPAANAA